MSLTQLAPSGAPGRVYGGFARGELVGGAHDPGLITTLGPAGLPGRRYGSFARGDLSAHDPGAITALGPMGMPGRRYAFEPKGAIVVPVPVSVGVGGFDSFKPPKRRRVWSQDDHDAPPADDAGAQRLAAVPAVAAPQPSAARAPAGLPAMLRADPGPRAPVALTAPVSSGASDFAELFAEGARRAAEQALAQAEAERRRIARRRRAAALLLLAD